MIVDQQMMMLTTFAEEKGHVMDEWLKMKQNQQEVLLMAGRWTKKSHQQMLPTLSQNQGNGKEAF